jgi:hypothetical protein
VTTIGIAEWLHFETPVPPLDPLVLTTWRGRKTDFQVEA